MASLDKTNALMSLPIFTEVVKNTVEPLFAALTQNDPDLTLADKAYNSAVLKEIAKDMTPLIKNVLAKFYADMLTDEETEEMIVLYGNPLFLKVSRMTPLLTESMQTWVSKNMQVIEDIVVAAQVRVG